VIYKKGFGIELSKMRQIPLVVKDFFPLNNLWNKYEIYGKGIVDFEKFSQEYIMMPKNEDYEINYELPIEVKSDVAIVEIDKKYEVEYQYATLWGLPYFFIAKDLNKKDSDYILFHQNDIEHIGKNAYYCGLYDWIAKNNKRNTHIKYFGIFFDYDKIYEDITSDPYSDFFSVLLPEEIINEIKNQFFTIHSKVVRNEILNDNNITDLLPLEDIERLGFTKKTSTWIAYKNSEELRNIVDKKVEEEVQKRWNKYHKELTSKPFEGSIHDIRYKEFLPIEKIYITFLNNDTHDMILYESQNNLYMKIRNQRYQKSVSFQIRNKTSIINFICCTYMPISIYTFITDYNVSFSHLDTPHIDNFGRVYSVNLKYDFEYIEDGGEDEYEIEHKLEINELEIDLLYPKRNYLDIKGSLYIEIHKLNSNIFIVLNNKKLLLKYLTDTYNALKTVKNIDYSYFEDNPLIGIRFGKILLIEEESEI